VGRVSLGVTLDLVEGVDAVEEIRGDGVALLGRDDEVAAAMRPAAQALNPLPGPTA
jgi:hypothetical protein